MLTRPWLLSLKRVKSWLLVSNKFLQTSSNHSRLGPPQSRALKKKKKKKVALSLCLHLQITEVLKHLRTPLLKEQTFFILKHDLKVLTPVRYGEVSGGLQRLQGKKKRIHESWDHPSSPEELKQVRLLTESRMEWRLIFKHVLIRGLLEWMCRSSRWKKLTLSWNVSEPPNMEEEK